MLIILQDLEYEITYLPFYAIIATLTVLAIGFEVCSSFTWYTTFRRTQMLSHYLNLDIESRMTERQTDNQNDDGGPPASPGSIPLLPLDDVTGEFETRNQRQQNNERFPFFVRCRWFGDQARTHNYNLLANNDNQDNNGAAGITVDTVIDVEQGEEAADALQDGFEPM